MKFLLRHSLSFGDNVGMVHADTSDSDALASAMERFRVAWGKGHSDAAARRTATPSNGVPHDFLPWFCGPQKLGYLSAARARLLAQHLQHSHLHIDRLDWNASHWDMDTRSEALQRVLLTLRDAGHLPGWRNETFSFFSADSDRPLLQAERAGFYFLGMRSDAVHVNGVTADGRMWIARRSASKAVDPGLLDNLCAGGLGAGETQMQAVVRELYEEAGIHLQSVHELRYAGNVNVGRVREGGWHEERLQVYNLLVAAGEQPANQDGEVQDFQLLEAAEIARRIAGGQFTPDAAAAINQGLLTQG
jgi:8-oxo-dGTP pyrophosphatase MutT (NUDIX family)